MFMNVRLLMVFTFSLAIFALLSTWGEDMSKEDEMNMIDGRL